jgi:NADH-quinone oxidoreductase subunit E
MLTEQEIQEIMHEAVLYPYPAGACIDALLIVQKHRRWISDESLADIAGLLGMSPDEVDSVATFYTRIYRRPVARNVILICDSITCMVMGYESIYQYISNKLGIVFGETTADERFTLLPNSCFGDCTHAPAMMVNDDHFNNLTTEQIDAILEKYK